MLSRLWYALPFTGSPRPSVAHLSLTGTIAPEGRSNRALNLASVEKALAKAFDVGGIKAVIVSINSPGGTPAQARMLHDRLRQLSEKKKVPLISYIEDVGASGGYMVALAGEEIFADPFAIVGSIGVVSAGFGAVEALQKLGLERRVYTAGDNKSQLDPFKPSDPGDVARLEDLLAKSHTLFIEMVKARRGGRLKGDEGELFNGNFWIAQDAVEHGLIDGTGDLRKLLQERYGETVQIRKVEVSKGSLLAKLVGGAMAGLSRGPLLALEDEAAWRRFGR